VRIRSLRNRLALIFGLIVAAAIGIVYLSVVPQLEEALREQKLDSLTQTAQAPTGDLERKIFGAADVGALVRAAADRSGTRVTVLDIATGSSLLLSVPLGGDSAPDADPDDTFFAVAQEAAVTGRTVRGTEPTTRGRIAEVAVPLRNQGEIAKIVVFSDDLEDVRTNVAFIRRQLLIAGAVALLLALLAGFLVARALAARVRRLEAAARKVASGDFSTRFEPESEDELGRLALAFDEMQTQLGQLDKARKQFIATASHELRTPIFSLGGFLELLTDEELDEDTRREFLAQISGQVVRLTKLTAELLDLSKLESGSLVLRPEPTDLGSLAAEVGREFRPALAHHDSDLEVRVGAGALEIECDPERVAQVLRILMDNALVHTPPGTGITLSADRENGEVRLAVTDTGLGIPRQTMPMIFEPFFTSDDTQGAGLGLAIASELAERMSGRLVAESVPGSTTFALVLPV